MSESQTPQPHATASVATRLALLALIAFIAVLAFVQTDNFLKNQKQVLKSQAVDECFKAARAHSTRFIEAEGKDLTIDEPIMVTYQTCLQDKGYTSVTQ